MTTRHGGPRPAVLRPGGRGRRDLPRPDPDRHHQLRRRVRAGGAQGGRARRRAARRGRHRGRAVRAASRAAPTWWPAGAVRRRRAPLLLHGHLDVVPAEADDWPVAPVLRRDPGRLPLGPRRGRHEGLRRDAALGGPGAGPGRRRAASGRSVLCFTADEEAGGHQGAEQIAGRASTATCSRAAPRRSARSAGSAPRSRGRRLYLIEAAEKGMAWMRLTARGRAGHGSMVNDDNAVTRLSAAVARIGAHEWPVRLTPTMQALLAAVGELAGTEATPENAEALVEEFGAAARMLGAVIRNTANPTMLERRLQGQRDPDRGDRARRRPVPAGLRGRVLRHPRRARAATGSSVDYVSAPAAAGRRRTTATSSTR